MAARRGSDGTRPIQKSDFLGPKMSVAEQTRPGNYYT
jgi:hypothetical protein